MGNRSEAYLSGLDDRQKASYGRLNDTEKSVYESAINNEPKITEDLSRFASGEGAHLEGLDYRIKSPSSVAEKIYDRPESTSIDNMNDIVRYTAIQEPDKLADSTNGMLSQMKENGYEISKVKNTWDDESNPYKGINVSAVSPEGQKFEVQFHTPDSFELKNSKEMHGLYEQARTMDPESDAYLALQDKMYEKSAELKRPANIENVQNFKEKEGTKWEPPKSDFKDPQETNPTQAKANALQAREEGAPAGMPATAATATKDSGRGVSEEMPATAATATKDSGRGVSEEMPATAATATKDSGRGVSEGMPATAARQTADEKTDGKTPPTDEKTDGKTLSSDEKADNKKTDTAAARPQDAQGMSV